MSTITSRIATLTEEVSSLVHKLASSPVGKFLEQLEDAIESLRKDHKDYIGTAYDGIEHDIDPMLNEIKKKKRTSHRQKLPALAKTIEKYMRQLDRLGRQYARDQNRYLREWKKADPDRKVDWTNWHEFDLPGSHEFMSMRASEEREEAVDGLQEKFRKIREQVVREAK